MEKISDAMRPVQQTNEYIRDASGSGGHKPLVSRPVVVVVHPEEGVWEDRG